MNVGEAARRTGLPIKTLHYYEEIELVTPGRQENGYRVFNETDIHKLEFIHRARGLGFSVEDCRALISLYEDENRASADVKFIASRHLDEIGTKIDALISLRSTLRHLVDNCHGNNRPDCPIIDGLAGNAKDPAH